MEELPARLKEMRRLCESACVGSQSEGIEEDCPFGIKVVFGKICVPECTIISSCASLKRSSLISSGIRERFNEVVVVDVEEGLEDFLCWEEDVF